MRAWAMQTEFAFKKSKRKLLFFFRNTFLVARTGLGPKTAPSIAYKPANRFAGAGYAPKTIAEL
jgi:hypothetical protein